MELKRCTVIDMPDLLVLLLFIIISITVITNSKPQNKLIVCHVLLREVKNTNLSSSRHLLCHMAF